MPGENRVLTAAQTEALEQRFKASTLREYPIDMPVPVYVGEARSLARWVDEHWVDLIEPQSGIFIRPGLHTSDLSPTVAEEIRWIIPRIDEAELAVTIAPPPAPIAALTAEAEALLDEIDAALDYAARRDADLREKLTGLRAARTAGGRSAGALSSALVQYGAVAAPLHATLHQRGRFDADRIARCNPLADDLRDARKGAQRKSAARVVAEVRRDRWLALLDERVVEIRAAARFVYRETPRDWRETVSAYKRAANRKQYKAKRERVGAGASAAGK